MGKQKGIGAVVVFLRRPCGFGGGKERFSGDGRGLRGWRQRAVWVAAARVYEREAAVRWRRWWRLCVAFVEQKKNEEGEMVMVLAWSGSKQEIDGGVCGAVWWLRQFREVVVRCGFGSRKTWLSTV